jgi:murein L,D-transpeptidase YcbB/YkuD
MKKNLQTLLKGIFLGSISSLIASQGLTASTYDLSKLKEKDDGQTEAKVKKDNSQKFLLKFQSDDSYLIAGHRSHASHASHASHRSSSTYSGSSYGTSSKSYSTPTPTSVPSNTSTSSNNVEVKSRNNSTDTTSNSYETINLGDRILKKGMIGNDVLQLEKILIEKNFLTENPNNESMLFDERIENAVISFQKSIGLLADGVVGSKTVSHLKE